MASMGVPRLVIARILNHAESGVTAVHDRYGYDREKREALEAWGRRLEEIVSEDVPGRSAQPVKVEKSRVPAR
jgi:hypothetical protein